MKITFAVLALMVFFPPESEASGSKLDQACVRAEVFKSKIYNCGQNHIAVQMAARCSDALMAMAKANGAGLHAVMEKLKADLAEGQRASMADTISRLKTSIRVLEGQITQFQQKTDIVAGYVKVMIDFPDAEVDVNSAECFSENFHPLQEIVTILDNEIVNSKRAREEALTLLAQTAASKVNMKNTPGSLRLPASSAPAQTKIPQGPTANDWGASDISGTKPKP
jgi:hypothetical protein